ncbi:heavy metal translocating P-type ATPase [Thiothrix lacustris]|uniref:heavy metal translocating P-type ATPase n=1 Tax=Thiothrix lacustris TaxID=525917 RepID=UPI0027E5B03A|nr:heavy metal translocating P-type ATPase [Thiothrix lacustris]WMP19416.1 heavy metal translocating P-type ATPase [Thiothrix lacustris]
MIMTGALTLVGGVYMGAKAFGLLPSQQKDKLRAIATNPMTLLAAAPLETDETDKALVVVENTAAEMTPEEERKMLDHFFKVSSGVLGVSAVTLATVPAAHVVVIPALLYTLLPVFSDAYDGLKKRKLRPSLVDSIAVGGAIGLGLVNNLNPYFFAAGAVGTWMYFLSAKLVLKTKDESIKELTNLFGEQARSVWLLKDGAEVEIPFEEVQIGDVVVVSAGGMIPVDGSIVKGIGSVDQRMLTGESQPVEKGIGEGVYAATTLLTGFLHIEVEKAGKDAVAAQIGEIWGRTADYRTSVETRGEQLSDKAVLPTLGAGAVALVTLGPIGATAILLSNFSDAIQLASPLSTLNFLHLASKKGILIKDGRALEGLKTVDTIVFDKTGTLTLEQPHVGGIFLCDGYDESTLLTYAAAAENKQSHPVAKAIIHAAKERGLELPALNDASYQVGYGIKAQIDGHWVRVGSDRFMVSEGIPIPDEIQLRLSESHDQGHTLIMVAIDEQLGGAIALHPTLRPEAKELVSKLKARGLSLCIISGDHHRPTKALADELGIEQFFAETLPEDKATLIAQLQEQGRSVCFIGDGINDTIALKQANVSISLSGATSAAMDTAQILMMDGSLNHLDKLFSLSSEFDKNLNNGFKTVLGGSVICVGGVFLFHFGIFSALALQGVTLAASVGNAYLPKIRDQYIRAALPLKTSEGA